MIFILPDYQITEINSIHYFVLSTSELKPTIFVPNVCKKRDISLDRDFFCNIQKATKMLDSLAYFLRCGNLQKLNNWKQQVSTFFRCGFIWGCISTSVLDNQIKDTLKSILICNCLVEKVLPFVITATLDIIQDLH